MQFQQRRPHHPFGPYPKHQQPPYYPPHMFYQMPHMKPPHPYMNPGANAKPPLQNIIQQFQKEDGQIDIDKVLTTANQVGATVKQLSPILKLFKPN